MTESTLCWQGSGLCNEQPPHRLVDIAGICSWQGHFNDKQQNRSQIQWSLQWGDTLWDVNTAFLWTISSFIIEMSLRGRDTCNVGTPTVSSHRRDHCNAILTCHQAATLSRDHCNAILTCHQAATLSRDYCILRFSRLHLFWWFIIICRSQPHDNRGRRDEGERITSASVWSKLS